ncbi:MAG: O-antigen ligase family protein [Anaerolineae bacterium]|nr:O-antigen ligase family protein [Anaerolineae bacterium]
MKTLLSLLLCLLLLIGGIATATGAAYRRYVESRGWSDPTTDADLPYRVPLAGVNIEMRRYADDDQLAEQLTKIASLGFVWLRQTFDWSQIEPTQGEFDFSAYDRIVTAVSQQPKLKIVAVLDAAPAWARRAEGSDRLYAPPSSMAQFASFAAALAKRYGEQIDYYQVWDEPNLNTHWGGLDPRPADYAAMLQAAYTAIHANDATATVITAGLAPTTEQGPDNLSDVLFLRALYEAGAKDYFDAVAGKPYGFDSSPLDRTVDPEVLNFSRLILLREEMLKYGDGAKALWGSHFGWNSLPPDWTGSPSIWGQVDAATQKRYVREAYTRAATEWAWVGGLILQAWNPAEAADDPLQGFEVATRAADWFDDGAFLADAEPGVGLHHPTDPRFHYQGDWEFGALGADVQHQDGAPEPPEDGSANQLSFSFNGQSLAFKVRRADYVAFLYPRVDAASANALPQTDKGAAYIMLKTPDLQPSTDLIVAAKDLAAGAHQAEVNFYLAYDQWVLAGIAIGGAGPNVAGFNLLISVGIIAALLGVITAGSMIRRLPRSSRQQARLDLIAYLRRMSDVIGGLFVSLLALLGLLLTFRNILPDLFSRETPTIIAVALTAGLAYFSPQFILTFVALAALWLIIYNRPVVGLALILFWAPFFLTPTQLYLWAFPMVEICLVLTISAVILRSLTYRPVPSDSATAPKFGSIDLVMLAFGALATLTLLWAEQRAPAIREWRTMILEPLLFFLLLRRLRLTDHELTRLVDVLLLAAVIVAVLGIYQFITGADGIVIAENGSRRITSVYGSPNNVALFLGRCFPFALAMLLIAPTTLRRIAAGVIVLLIGVAVLFTQSAGAILLGIPASVIVVALLWNRRIGLIVLGVTLVGLLAFIPLSRFVPRFQGLLNLSRSTSFVRTQLWTSTYYLLRDRPITGAGLDQFLYLYRSRYILPDAWREPNLSHPHNVVLDYWVSLGIGGLIILAAQQVLFWRTGWRSLRDWRKGTEDKSRYLLAALTIGAMGSMANFLAHGMVDNSYFVVDLSYVFCFTMALVFSVSRMASSSASSRDPVGVI